MKPSYEELEQQLSASIAAERVWETSMMQACGEDGPKSVAEKFAELEAKCAALAAENAGLLPKAASELSNAWVLHKYLIGIQAAIMYLDNGNQKAAQEWLYGTIAGPGFDFPDGVDDIDAWATHQMRGSVSHHQALEIIKAETPTTDAFMAEVRASAVDSLIDIKTNQLARMHPDTHAFGATADFIRSQINELQSFATLLRKGVQS
ncbi:hypothetical protein LZP96_09650 [Enterobacteriaceae bacterium 155047]|uniref:hypothetical protein n=1 Tax=Huaxiibacter chinensis TaxID=2899785 RepID=UPI002164D681|nr:hypothetical protein [Huaxiibacter chinensis]MCG5044302.1 hypothetical protein [Huaxiibacter chinensis]